MMIPNSDWLDTLTDGVNDVTNFCKNPRKIVAFKVGLAYTKAAYTVLALPLVTLAATHDLPVIKATPSMRDALILSTNVSTIAPSPVIESQTYYTTTE